MRQTHAQFSTSVILEIEQPSLNWDNNFADPSLTLYLFLCRGDQDLLEDQPEHVQADGAGGGQGHRPQVNYWNYLINWLFLF